MSTSKLQKKVQAQGLPPMPDIGHGRHPRAKTNHRKEFTPLGWQEFFDQKELVKINDEDSFNVYRKGSSGLLFLLLHGGGYSGLTWSCFTEDVYQILDCQVMAIDFRGHGDTVTANEDDFSTDILTNDVLQVFNKVFQGKESPPVVIIGHSMGGAIAVHVGSKIANLAGLAVIDVVEGSAMQALEGMHQFLRGRPQTFQNVQQAIEWCLRSGTVKNLKSARVSMPGQVIQVTHPSSSIIAPSPPIEVPMINELEEIQEDAELQSSPSPRTTPSPSPDQPEESVHFYEPDSHHTPEHSHSDFKHPLPVYTWRIDLTKTASYWSGWFSGLSNLFLSVSAPKLLLLAGVDRLDKDLTVGQMQGKFQMIVLPKVGHALHEDSPTKVAEALATFCTRNKLTTAKQEFEPVFPGC